MPARRNGPVSSNVRRQFPRSVRSATQNPKMRKHFSVPSSIRCSLALTGIGFLFLLIYAFYQSGEYIIYRLEKHPRNWVRYFQNQATTYYIDTNSVRKASGLAQYTIMLDFAEDVAPAKSVQITAEIDCSKQLRRVVLLGPNFSQSMGTGQPIGTPGPPSGALKSSRDFQRFDREKTLIIEGDLVCQ